MRNFFTTLLLALLLLLPCVVIAQNISSIPNQLPPSCQPDDTRKPLLLLGSYHMANPGLDKFNLKADDVTVPKRQQEIQILVNSLAQFKPTKVAIERPYVDSTVVIKYQNYLDGEYELGKSESQQIGFRLAKMMGHDSIYPIDIHMSLNSQEMGKLVTQKPELQKYMAGVQNSGQRAMQMMGEWLSKGTISEMLFNMNKPEMLNWTHSIYLEHFLPVVHGDNYAGADYLTTWYQRNIRIFSNLHKISAIQSDRIMVIYGQGHIPILKDLANHSPYFCLEDPLPFLENS